MTVISGEESPELPSPTPRSIPFFRSLRRTTRTPRTAGNHPLEGKILFSARVGAEKKGLAPNPRLGGTQPAAAPGHRPQPRPPCTLLPESSPSHHPFHPRSWTRRAAGFSWKAQGISGGSRLCTSLSSAVGGELCGVRRGPATTSAAHLLFSAPRITLPPPQILPTAHTDTRARERAAEKQPSAWDFLWVVKCRS